MKKKIFTLLMALVAVTVSAQVPSGQNVKRSKAAGVMKKATPSVSQRRVITRTPTDANTFVYDFNDGTLQGWTNLLVNADGGQWIISEANPGGYDYSDQMDGSFIMCYSFIDNVGERNTDAYLVSPQAYTISAGSNMTFQAEWANADYPEHFDVCIAETTEAPTAADFTKIWNSNGIVTADYGQVPTSVTIDLSEYEGKTIWIAFHDKNYDYYEVWIDNVTVNAAAATPEGLAINEENFPDVNFRAYISSADSGIDDDQNGYLSDEEIAGVTNIGVDELEIADLTGIQYFTNLMSLYCSYNMLTALDLSALSHLEYIDCSYNQIATLDLSQNTALIIVWCHGNQLTSLNVEGLAALRGLRCYWNMLKGDAMAQLVDALNDVEVSKEFLVYNELSIDISMDKAASYPYPMAKRAPRKGRLYEEGNEITAEQVKQAFTKYWVPGCYNGRYWTEYFGKIDATVEEILTLKDGMTISANFGMFEQVKPLLFIELLLEMEILTIPESSSDDLINIEKDGKQLFTLTWNSDNREYVVTLADGVTSADDFTVEISEELRNEVLNYSSKEGIEPLTSKRLAPRRRSEPEFTELDLMQWIASLKSVTIHFANEADGIAIDETNFPDQNFREYLLAQSYGEDAMLTEEEIAAITSLNLYGRNIADLTGIEHFTALTWLDCSMNQLTKLDLSKNTALTEVRFYSNQINQTAMQALLESLPKGNGYILYVFDEDNADEGNVITEEQVAFAADKGWNVKNNFGDPYAGTTGIRSLTTTISQGVGAWYTLDGRRLDSEPTQKGIYIYNGKKVRK